MHIKLSQFHGMAPKIGERNLNNEGSQESRNANLWSGEIRALRKPLDIGIPAKTGTIKTIYLLDDKWLHWTQDVDVVSAPSETEDAGRTYYSGHHNPKSTNYDLATAGGSEYPEAFYRMGLPSPDNAPTVTPSGGSATADTRAYLYTFISAWGEESPPSVSKEATGKVDDTWALTNMDAAPPNSMTITNITYASGVATVTVGSDHFLETKEVVEFSDIIGAVELNGLSLPVTRTATDEFTVAVEDMTAYTSGGTADREAPIQIAGMMKNIYRTNTAGRFVFVDQIAVTTTTYNDTVASTELGEEIPSTDYYAPPGDLTGIVSLPNGILAGFVGKTVYFCEPYQPHAYPESYELNVSFNIVGLGVFGSSVLVLTEGTPYLITGSHPANMSMDAINYQLSCVSRQSIVGLRDGVTFASPDGLVSYRGGSPELITQGYLEKLEWSKYSPSTMRGAIYDDRYYGFYENGGDDFDVSGGIIFDPSEPSAVFTLTEVSAAALYRKASTDDLFMVSDGVLRQFDVGGSEEQAYWKSKAFVMPRPCAMVAGKVRFTATGGVTKADSDAALAAAMETTTAQIADGTIISNGSLGGGPLGAYTLAGGPYLDVANNNNPPLAAVTLLVYADGNLVHTEAVVDENSFRLPGDYLADVFEFEISSNELRIHEVILADNMSELAGL